MLPAVEPHATESVTPTEKQPDPTTVSVLLPVVVPTPSFTAKFILSVPEPKVSVRPLPCPRMVEFSSNIRFDAAPTSPMMTSELAGPMTTRSEPVVLSIRKSVPPVDEVAIVQANGELSGMVEVEMAEKLTRPPENTGVPVNVGDAESTAEPVPVTAVIPVPFIWKTLPVPAVLKVLLV